MSRLLTLIVACSFVLVMQGCQKWAPDPAKPAASESTGKKEDGAATDAVSESAASSKPADAAPDAAKPATESGVQPVSVNLPRTADELKAMRAKHDETIWSNEVLAQRHEKTFVDLWDNLIHQPDPFQVLREFRFGRFLTGTTKNSESLDWSIERLKWDGPVQEIPYAEWSDWLTKWENDGYRILETEFHHSAFEPSPSGATSKVAYLIHATHSDSNQRFIVRGNLQIRWLPDPDPTTGLFIPDTIDAGDAVVLARQGNPAFKTERVDRLPTDGAGKTAPTAIHPIILQDLNGDGLLEIIVGGYNQYYKNKGNWQFEFARLCEKPVPHVNAGAMADFNGDGNVDYVAAVKNGVPYLYFGTAEGTFPDAPMAIKAFQEPMRVPITVTPGDIDRDGDLDLFLGQQKPGYFNGDIPTPYYDARDSFPSYMLLNDGAGNFTDVTEKCGLGDKSHRRNFAASFIDYDHDDDLDLILTSDFSGTDVFQNDGKGQFTDISDKLKPQAYAFGMSHTFGDYDLDGGIDFLTVGMSSTTARRLEHMKLRRNDFAEYDQNRMNMGYGNRLYVFKNGQFEQASFNADVARTGWSWGSTTLDFDNDADPDIYVVNGQTSGKTTQDYCTSFWCHDVYYKRGERPDAAIRELFNEMAPQFNGNGISWNGYEHNALLMNVDGKGFVNIGFLMGVGFEFDSRMAVSGDIDQDGRVDLVVEHKDHRESQSKLYVVRNVWDQPGHFIGVHLDQKPGKPSPMGARVTATLKDGRVLLQHNVAGHSVWAQHANSVHFGLGDAAEVEAMEVRWPDGSTSRLEKPAVDTYHRLSAD